MNFHAIDKTVCDRSFEWKKSKKNAYIICFMYANGQTLSRILSHIPSYNRETVLCNEITIDSAQKSTFTSIVNMVWGGNDLYSIYFCTIFSVLFWMYLCLYHHFMIFAEYNCLAMLYDDTKQQYPRDQYVTISLICMLFLCHFQFKYRNETE